MIINHLITYLSMLLMRLFPIMGLITFCCRLQLDLPQRLVTARGLEVATGRKLSDMWA